MRVLVAGACALAAVSAGSSSTAPPQVLLTYGISYAALGSATPAGGGLCLARPDGSHAVRLTTKRDERGPAWSPRGRYLAFFRQTTARESSRNGAVFEIYIADGRGRIVRNLSRGFAVFNTDPAWSPNGKRLAFTAGWRGSVVAVVRRISGRPRVLVPDAFSPEWSPDGTKLAFATEDGIYTIRPNGSDRRLLVEDATDPDFSADGQHLAFVRRTATGRQSELYVAKADGSDARQLTHSTESESDPAWSPDGKLIAFTRWDADPRTNRYWVIVIRSDTGEEYAVIRGPHSAFGPTWRPAVSLPRANRRPCR